MSFTNEQPNRRPLLICADSFHWSRLRVPTRWRCKSSKQSTVHTASRQSHARCQILLKGARRPGEQNMHTDWNVDVLMWPLYPTTLLGVHSRHYMPFMCQPVHTWVVNVRFTFLPIRFSKKSADPIPIWFNGLPDRCQNKWIDVLTGPSVYYGPILI